MKKIFIAIGFIALLGWGCQKEDALTPSGADSERVLQYADMSRPLVKAFYEKYGCGILFDFDLKQDVHFIMGDVKEQDAWNLLVVDKFTSSTAMDSALNTLDTMILKYFKDEITFQGKTYKSDFKKRYFPTKIILSPSIENQSTGALIPFTQESTRRANANGVGGLHCIGNINSFVFNMNPGVIYSSASKYKEFKNDGLYIFLADMIDRHDLYSQIPDEFFSKARHIYGRSLEDVQRENGQAPSSLSRFEYMALGFMPREFDPMSIHYMLNLPTREQDVRHYLNELINPFLLTWSGDDNKAKMKILAMTLLKWGVDVFAINPAMEALCRDN